jgi:hypothetical protein
MGELSERHRQELDSAFRKILRDAGLKGPLAGEVADLIEAVRATFIRRAMGPEEIVAAMDQLGGFMRVGDGAMVNGCYVTPGELVDALLFKVRRDAESTSAAESEQ